MLQLIGSPADWAANDLVLGNGELGFELGDDGTLRAKVGDGAQTFTQLDYAFFPGGGGVDGAFMCWDNDDSLWARRIGMVFTGGNLGLGTTEPLNDVHINSEGTGFSVLRFTATPDTTLSDWQMRAHDSVLDFYDMVGGGIRVSFGDGVTVGNPASGDQGVGTVNVTGGYYVNGTQMHVITQAMYDDIISRLVALEP